MSISLSQITKQLLIHRLFMTFLLKSNHSQVPNCCPLLINFWKFFQPPTLIRMPCLLFFAQKFFKTFLRPIFWKNIFLLAIVLHCLHSQDHRCLIYERRLLHSSTILDLKTLFLPPSLPAYQILLMFTAPFHLFRPPGNRHIRVNT